MNILLVDDDEMILRTIGDFLSRRGHHLRTAPDGPEALRLVEDEPPDLPVILMTGYATVETAVAALRHRAYDYLKKPIQLQELQACIERVEPDNHPKT